VNEAGVDLRGDTPGDWDVGRNEGGGAEVCLVKFSDDKMEMTSRYELADAGQCDSEVISIPSDRHKV
jgi:hypothetical protein